MNRRDALNASHTEFLCFQKYQQLYNEIFFLHSNRSGDNFVRHHKKGAERKLFVEQGENKHRYERSKRIGPEALSAAETQFIDVYFRESETSRLQYSQ